MHFSEEEQGYISDISEDGLWQRSVQFIRDIWRPTSGDPIDREHLRLAAAALTQYAIKPLDWYAAKLGFFVIDENKHLRANSHKQGFDEWDTLFNLLYRFNQDLTTDPIDRFDQENCRHLADQVEASWRAFLLGNLSYFPSSREIQLEEEQVIWGLVEKIERLQKSDAGRQAAGIPKNPGRLRVVKAFRKSQSERTVKAFLNDWIDLDDGIYGISCRFDKVTEEYTFFDLDQPQDRKNFKGIYSAKMPTLKRLATEAKK